MRLDYDFTLLSLVFMRMAGCILFNPILGRRNIPAMAKAGLTLLMTLFTYSLIPGQPVPVTSLLVYIVMLVKELLVGFAVGYVIQMFQSVIVLGGSIMDYQIGISMSQVYDPQSNVSMPLSASMLNVMFMILFFSSNAHVTLLQIFVQLGQICPYGTLTLSPRLLQDLVGLFSTILIYAVKLSLPILAVEVIVEMCVGLLMKAVPQINVFVVNLQLKILIGFVMLLVLVPVFSTFLERMITLMFDQIQHIAVSLAQ